MTASKSRHFDYPLLADIVIILVAGILILASVSAVFSQQKFHVATYYLFHQLLWGILPGLVLGFFAFKINLSFFKKWSWIFVLINLFLMVLVFVPKIGIIAGGAPRWLDFKFFTFQPSEFLKLTLLIYLSTWLANRSEGVNLKKHGKVQNTLMPFLVILSVIALVLVFQSDLSTLLVIMATAGIVYFSASTPLWHSALMISAAVGASYFLIRYVPYRYNRLLVVLDSTKDPMGIGYQLKQALIAVGSGGIFGLGLGMSRQKFGFVPQASSDAVFAIFAEEMGFIGSCILVFLFLFFLWRGFRIARKNPDIFSRLFGLGFISWICVQTFINMGAMVGVIPLAGIPFPLISYGGSHIIAELIGVGILFNISRRKKLSS